jgi:hypothetical protein
MRQGYREISQLGTQPMPMLTESTIKGAKPSERPCKLFDERGLFMLVTRAGGRLWRFRYRIISARLATASERDDYEQNLFHS